MTKQSSARMSKLQRGTQELLERRGMAATPRPLGPAPLTKAPPAGGGRTSFGDAAFRHGGREGSAMSMQSAPAMHAELKGHRHRGAEKHSAH
ncbi:hypothetical protein [Kitasatospora sp. NPDC057015]|uniref:hypothetical protein n=1 Tax=Kitasatospora sp. NPDC057015 TaxID=3346001 RepID=UPI0036276666